ISLKQPRSCSRFRGSAQSRAVRMRPRPSVREGSNGVAPAGLLLFHNLVFLSKPHGASGAHLAALFVLGLALTVMRAFCTTQAACAVRFFAEHLRTHGYDQPG